MRLFFVLWWLLLPAFVQAQRAVTLSDSTQVYPLEGVAEVLKLEGKRLSFEQILLPENQRKFAHTGKPLSFGYYPQPVWIKIKLKNNLPKTRWILEMPIALVDTVAFYQETAKGWQKSEIGFYMPFSKREIAHTGFAFPIRFEKAGEAQTFYFCMRGTSAKVALIRVLEREKFYARSRHADVAYGMFFGIFLIMFCYNLMIYITLRDTSYLLYILTIFFTFSTVFTVSGYGNKYVWGEYPLTSIWTGRGALGGLGLSVAWFCIQFLEVKRYSKWSYYALLAVIPASLVAMLLSVTLILPSATNNFLSIVTPLFMFVGVQTWVLGNRLARFFVAAWLFYMIGGVSITLRNSGVLPANFWTTHLFEIGAACETFLIAFALSDRYRRMKEDAQADLEKKVLERTQALRESNEELLTLNEEIRQQSDEIIVQRDALETAYGHIEQQNTDVLDSMQYAKRIQDALLPTRTRLERFFVDTMLVYLPKDIVSGDFYWFTTVDSWRQVSVENDGLGLSLSNVTSKNKKILFLAVADCTGHGVPGAFMTMIGGGLLDQIINRDKIYSPAQILQELDRRLLRTLQQRGNENDQIQDGMDISLLQMDLSNEMLVWASAKRPLWLLEKGSTEFTIYKGDKYPIGSSQFKEKNFTEHEIQLHEGDTLYTFSDGYADQFGQAGKMTIRRFKHILLENRFKPFASQELLLQTYLNEWQGGETQTDDILVLGLRIG